jgi:very-short-patch-repair endonuclease
MSCGGRRISGACQPVCTMHPFDDTDRRRAWRARSVVTFPSHDRRTAGPTCDTAVAMLTGVAPPTETSAVDRRVAELAASQHGVVARDQLRALGLTDTMIAWRVRAGRLHRVRRAVYAVGHPALTPHGRWLAAVLALGPGARLSHGSAGALWDLRRSSASSIDVTVPGSGRRASPGVRTHRVRRNEPDEATIHRGIAVTTPARTVLDLAGDLPRRGLERVLDRAEELRLTDRRALAAIAAAHHGHRGAGPLRRALADHVAGTTLTRSALEERMLALCREHGLARPRVNHWVAGLEVDFLFEAQRVVIETDGWAHHRTRAAFERDRDRDAALARAGHRVLRFTHRQLADDPRAVAATIAAALA